MLINAAVQLLLNHVEHASEYRYLATRKVKCLIGSVVKKLVSADVSAQLGAVEQIGVEHQRRPFWIYHIGIRLHVNLLPWRKTGDGHFVEVVFGAPIRQFAPFVLFQKQRIQSVVIHRFLQRPLLVEARNAHQRVQCVESVVIVKFLYGVVIYFFHFLMIFKISSAIWLASNRLSASSC